MVGRASQEQRFLEALLFGHPPASTDDFRILFQWKRLGQSKVSDGAERSRGCASRALRRISVGFTQARYVSSGQFAGRLRDVHQRELDALSGCMHARSSGDQYRLRRVAGLALWEIG